jgi:anti-anti-sigma regulatory factor
MQLVLDLSAVNFFGTQGFAALHYISVSCARNDMDWARCTATNADLRPR